MACSQVATDAARAYIFEPVPGLHLSGNVHLSQSRGCWSYDEPSWHCLVVTPSERPPNSIPQSDGTAISMTCALSPALYVLYRESPGSP